jgi:hypothetical protein
MTKTTGFGYALTPDASVRRAAEKAMAKAVKAWEKGMKDYEKAPEKAPRVKVKDARMSKTTTSGRRNRD